MPTSPRDGSPPHRIAKLLARAGIASRREIERMIEDRRIAIAGVAVETPATLLETLDGVTVDGQPVAAPEAARLFLFHKPPGLLTTERDPRGRPTIYDRLPKGLPRLMPVGRLDLATEGLLLMTTDGGLKRQLELPATGVERAYRARAYGQVSQPQLEELIHGIEIEGIRYGAIDANIERRTGANLWIELILTEGKNREVRRVLEHLGLQVSRLIRTRYGPFVLGDLPPGEIGEVRRHDVESFRADPRRRELPQPARRGVARLEREAEHAAEERAPRERPAPGRRRDGEPQGTRKIPREGRRPPVRDGAVATAGSPVRARRPDGDTSGRAERRPARAQAAAADPRPSSGPAPRNRAEQREPNGPGAKRRVGRPADGAGPSRKPAPARANAGENASKPAATAKPGGKDGPRRRADGTLAVRGGGARADRARTFRGERGDAPPRPDRPRGKR